MKLEVFFLMPFNYFFFLQKFLGFSNELYLHAHYQHPSTNGIRAVVLCPTRELATQTTRESKKLAKGKKFRIKLMTRQLLRSADMSKLPCDILISTPLRLRFAIRKKKLNLSRCVVLISYLCNLIHAGRKTKPINRMMVCLKKNLWLNNVMCNCLQCEEDFFLLTL